jgi:hypothetical protein
MHATPLAPAGEKDCAANMAHWPFLALGSESRYRREVALYLPEISYWLTKSEAASGESQKHPPPAAFYFFSGFCLTIVHSNPSS